MTTFHAPLTDDNPLRIAIRENYHADETRCVERLLDGITIDQSQQQQITLIAKELVEAIRNDADGHGGLDAFLQEYKLSSEEGVALMCLAEALLRVPDAETANALIEDKLAKADWESHLGHSESFFVNASTWGLMLTGKVISLDKAVMENAGDYLARLVARSGDPVIRAAVSRAMKFMGRQFVLAENIEAGLKAARHKEEFGYCYSYDMLGEAARTADDAERYFQSYQRAIDAIGGNDSLKDPLRSAGISVKLSALHPRYEYSQAARVMNELLPRIKSLCLAARSHGIGLTIDAEESERLDPSLSILESLSMDSDLDQWNGLGFVVQGYQKRAPAVIDWIEDLVSRNNRKIMIRLVKGAYWDTEIKQAQLNGFSDYPVFTRKIATDVSYLHCAQKLLASPDRFYPLFATHNAHTVASILAFAGDRRDFEFQCLHGMGEILYDQVVNRFQVACRIYAPVGPYKDLLAYLVRRLLENGANSSFVNRLVDKELPIERIIRDPVKSLIDVEPKAHPNIPLPAEIYRERINSAGLNLFDSETVERYYNVVAKLQQDRWEARPMTPLTKAGGKQSSRETELVLNPATGGNIGMVEQSCDEDIQNAFTVAAGAWEDWDGLGGIDRAEILRTAAELYQQHRDEFLYLCNVEAGKTLLDAIAEIREAIDFLRYYARQAQKKFGNPQTLQGPTGETNLLSLHGRGTFVCISPWNFPLAIFTGQVSAALAAGNCVITKPAEQTPLIASLAVKLLHRAGVPQSVLHYLPGDGVAVGAKLIEDHRADGVAFTGSTDTAGIILKTLAATPGPIIPFIAETGGINAMIVDSTALPEQVVRDVIASSFQSAGQRCSALRVLYLQNDVAGPVLTMLRGAMDELKLGNPMDISTDIGPIIDKQARDGLSAYLQTCIENGWKVTRGPDASESDRGYFFSPAIIEINGIADLEREVFGPVLHIARFDASEIDSVVDDINEAGYGLTFGIHSRIQSTVERIRSRIRAGNIYVNRNTIGAVVGVQPFGGEGLSGTGPKAGGPNYLHGFAVERSVSIDTTAAGGNTSLLSLETI